MVLQPSPQCRGREISYSLLLSIRVCDRLAGRARKIKLPDNDKIRILAISVAEENPEVKPAQPLYDVLPSPNAGPADFTLSASSASVSFRKDGAPHQNWSSFPEAVSRVMST